MDTQQPDLRQGKLTPIRPALVIVGALTLALACGQVPPDEGGLQTAVPATLTALAPTTAPETSAPAPSATAAATASPEPSAAPTSTQPPATIDADDDTPGTISGSLSYPSESIPPLAVVFFNQDDGTWWWIGTAQNQMSYQMTVPPGTYHVVAYASGDFAGGYSAAVPCGLSAGCTDHSLLDVVVAPNTDVTGIDPGDWYAPAGTFPSKPAAISYP